MPNLNVKEYHHKFKPEHQKNVPGAKAAMNVVLTTNEPIEGAMVKVVFDGKLKKVIVNSLPGNQFYGNYMGPAIVGGGETVKFGFGNPAFDEKLQLTFTVYSEAPVKVVSAEVTKT